MANCGSMRPKHQRPPSTSETCAFDRVLYQAGANAPGFKMRFIKWCGINDTGRFFGRFKISNSHGTTSTSKPVPRMGLS